MKEIIQFTAGKGPLECSWVVAQVLKIFIKEIESLGFKYWVIHREKDGENGTLKNAVLQVDLPDESDFLKSWIGSVQWIGTSNFRKSHKRKNWFIGVNLLPQPKTRQVISDKEIDYTFIRSSGPGGQHVNKVSTAVRAKHLPTGIEVLVQDNRSQSLNKKVSKTRLQSKLDVFYALEMKTLAEKTWHNHQAVSRGNPVKVIVGKTFQKSHVAKKYRDKRSRSNQNWKEGLND